ncbi:hypothetical protein [Methanobrevibacter smithii]|uniref:hypothetical protein n=1 Tax=Methanobrevibacter smithii TaxID=2173 RepID=UPI0037DCDCA2
MEKNKLKKLCFLSVTFLFLFLVNINVRASVLEKINVKNDLVRVVVSAENENCPAFGDPNIETDPAYWIQWVLNLMKYMAIIALLVLVISDFFKAIVENDKDALKKAGNKALKRFIYCVLLFFLPTIISLIMTMFGAYGTCGIG